MTKCTHPNYSYLRYIGLDTKKSKDYLGSSLVLKWFISLLGRSSFEKVILDTVSGDMRTCCELEQQYILTYDAVRDPNFLNMNGGRQVRFKEHEELDMDYRVRPVATISQGYINEKVLEVRDGIVYFSFLRGQLASQILSLLIYANLKYQQEDFEYSQYRNYFGCTPEVVDEVVDFLSGRGYIDAKGSQLSITEKLVDSLPLGLSYEDFSSQIME